jgi:hemerythrin
VPDHSALENALLKVSINALTMATVEHFRHEDAVLRLELRGKMAADAINEHLADHAMSLTELESILHAIMSRTEEHDRSPKLKLTDWFLAHATG